MVNTRLSVLASHLRPSVGPSPDPAPHPVGATSNKLRVAVAGCHRQTTQPLAGHNFSSALAVNPDVEVVGVFDHGAATRAAYVDCWGETWPGLAAFESFDDLMGTEPDIVVIAARQTMHADFVERAVAAGAKGLLVDKPLCTSLEEADRIAAACAEGSGVPLLYALDRRWNAAWDYLRQAVADGMVGEVRAASCYGVSNTVNHGCHYTDLILGLLGDPEPAWVSGRLENPPTRQWSPPPPSEREAMDPASDCLVGFADSGAVAHFTPAGALGVELVGDLGRLVVYGDAAAATLSRADGSREDLPVPSDDSS